MNCAECKEILFAYLEGLLAESEKHAVTEHLKDCHTCQAELKQLTSLQERLVGNGRAVAQSDLEDEVLNRIIREQNVRLKAAGKAGAGLKLRRLIMRSSVTRIAVAAAVLVVAALGVNYMMAPSVTFAEVIKPILNARTMIFDFIVGDEETSPTINETFVGQRMRKTISNMPGLAMVIDLDSSKMLVLNDADKIASYVDIQGPLQERSQSYVGSMRKMITELQDNYQELGEQELDGRKTIVFEAKGPNEEVKIWADPKTALPIRMELRIGQLFVIMKNFQLDPPIDDSLISMDVPPGYTLGQTDFDMSDATEQDFIESLRIWAEVMRDGMFPEAIGTENVMKQMPLLGEKMMALNLSEEEATQMGMSFGKGMLFHQILETGGEWHYAGAGVKLGDAEKEIFWYKLKDSENWRVIYGDLSVKDVAPENLPK
jgi:hypothetical protein